MNMKAIIASLVVGSSSVAMAAPAVTFSAPGRYDSAVVRDHADLDEDCDPAVTTLPAPAPVYHALVYQDPVYRQARYDRPWFWRSQAQRPVLLASGMSFANQGRAFITVGDEAGRFGSLQISAAGGRTFIKQVYVQFDNGQEQVIRDLNRTLVGNQTVTLDLDGHRRGIRRIVVYGADGGRSVRRNLGAFNVTAV